MSLIQAFMPEIEQIRDEKIREFAVEVLAEVSDYYAGVSSYISETKQAFKYSDTLIQTLGSSDYVNDVVKTAILLQDITRYIQAVDDDEDIYMKEDLLHPLSVRVAVLPHLGIVGKDTFDDILRTVESSHGLNGPIPHVVPSIDSPIHIWILPFVNHLARAYPNN